MIVIGLGTGRSGTASLASLLSKQRNSLCFHEVSAVTMRFFGTPRPAINTVEEFQAILAGGPTHMLTADLSRPSVASDYDRLCAMPSPALLGDVGYYYLTYVAAIAEQFPEVRFVCMQRDRAQTIDSWVRQARISYRGRRDRLAAMIASIIRGEPYRPSRNFWQDHDGSTWQLDPVWDKTFPKFPEATDMLDAIGRYYDLYYDTAGKLAQQLSGRFRIFDIKALQELSSQSELLRFCGLADAEMTLLPVRRNVGSHG